MHRRAKILFCISEDFYFLSHRKDLYIRLAEAGLSMHLATNADEYQIELERLGINFYQVDLNRKSLSPASVIIGASRYIKIFKKVKPDLIIAVALKPIVCAALAAKFIPNTKLLCAFAGLGITFSGNSRNLRLALIRFAFSKTFPMLLDNKNCRCLFQNNDDADLFIEKKWIKPQASNIINGAGVNLNEFTPRSWHKTTHPKFLFAGRLLWDKGVRELVEACRLLKAKGYNFTCKIAGLIDETNPNAVPIKYIESAHKSRLIDWLGERSDMPKVLKEADCFVFPTLYREGVPKVLLEASATAIPIITTQMPGCKDVVEDEKTGLLVKPRSIEGLAAAMERCILQPHLLQQWGTAAYDKALRLYGIESVVARHLDIINEFLQNPNSIHFNYKSI